MRRLLLVRHAHAASNDRGLVSFMPPGEGLSAIGIAQAADLRRALESEAIDLGVSSQLERTRMTLDLALGDRPVARIVLAALDEIDFGAFEGGPLEDYRQWAWTTPPGENAPGGGESRAAAARRVAGALRELVGRSEESILAVGHALPLRYVLDAAAGVVPRARITPVPHATPHVLGAADVERAIGALEAWASRPRFAGDGADTMGR